MTNNLPRSTASVFTPALDHEISNILKDARQRGIDCPPDCTIAQFAGLIHRPESTVREWFNKGRFPQHIRRRRGKRFMVRRDLALQHYLEDDDWE